MSVHPSSRLFAVAVCFALGIGLAGPVRPCSTFLLALPLPDGFFTAGGLSRREFCERAATRWHAGEGPEVRRFAGRWEQVDAPADEDGDGGWSLELAADGNRVSGTISKGGTSIHGVALDHLRVIGSELACTFRRDGRGDIFELRATIEDTRMTAHLLGTEDDFGTIAFRRH